MNQKKKYFHFKQILYKKNFSPNKFSLIIFSGGAIPEAIQAELEDLKADKLRLERKVEKLSKELDDKKKEIEQLKVTFIL